MPNNDKMVRSLFCLRASKAKRKLSLRSLRNIIFQFRSNLIKNVTGGGMIWDYYFEWPGSYGLGALSVHPITFATSLRLPTSDLGPQTSFLIFRFIFLNLRPEIDTIKL